MNGMLYRPCPVCESLEYEIIKKVNYCASLPCFCPTAYDIVNCVSCGAVYHRFKTEEESQVNKLYAHYTGMNREIKIDTSSLTPTSNPTLNILYSFVELGILKNARILDVGSSWGEMLYILKQDGFCDLHAIDMDPKAIEIINSFGINGAVGSIYDAFPEYEASCDLIILSNVLEHLFYTQEGDRKCIKVVSS